MFIIQHRNVGQINQFYIKVCLMVLPCKTKVITVMKVSPLTKKISSQFPATGKQPFYFDGFATKERKKTDRQTDRYIDRQTER